MASPFGLSFCQINIHSNFEILYFNFAFNRICIFRSPSFFSLTILVNLLILNIGERISRRRKLDSLTVKSDNSIFSVVLHFIGVSNFTFVIHVVEDIYIYFCLPPPLCSQFIGHWHTIQIVHSICVVRWQHQQQRIIRIKGRQTDARIKQNTTDEKKERRER